MKAQYSHNLMSSFFLWFDNKLVADGTAVITGRPQTFRYAEGIDTPSNMYSFYSSERQFCADTGTSPNSVYISGISYPQDTTGTNKVVIDHDQGRILLSKTFSTGLAVSGNFIQKEINLYVTNETEEEILVNKEFYVQSGQSYLESINQIAKARYCLPAVFLTEIKTKNEPFAIGGTRDTQTYIKAVVFANSSYQRDGILSLFRDSSERCLKIIDQSSFPYGQYWQVKNAPYSYTGLIATGSIDEAFIEETSCYTISDNKKKLRKDIYMGYIDFNISCIRG